ncbi:hypothetical protein BT69DRAFT_835672 [Atractiella rhizophila]|nr:hypothetical protein BT69DRAFT_835672 [Atractiella rhizophila]
MADEQVPKKKEDVAALAQEVMNDFKLTEVEKSTMQQINEAIKRRLTMKYGPTWNVLMGDNFENVGGILAVVPGSLFLIPIGKKILCIKFDRHARHSV